MFKLTQSVVKRLLVTSICCLAVGAFTLVPMTRVSGRSVVPVSTATYYGYYDTFYSDANQTEIVGEYNSCTHVLTGHRTPYKYTEIIICG
jgi:hypothetical protein